MVRFSHDGDLLALATEEARIDIASFSIASAEYQLIALVNLQASVETGEIRHTIKTPAGAEMIAFSPTRAALAYVVNEGTPGKFEGVCSVLASPT